MSNGKEGKILRRQSSAVCSLLSGPIHKKNENDNDDPIVSPLQLRQNESDVRVYADRSVEYVPGAIGFSEIQTGVCRRESEGN